MRSHWKAAVGVAVSALCLWWVFRGEDLGAIGRQLAAADFPLLVLAGAISTGGGLVRAVRWRLLLEPLGVPTTLNARWKALNIGFMVTNIVPARVGEIARPYALSRLAPVSMSGALGTVVLERVLDAVALLVLLLVAVLSPAFPEAAVGRSIAVAVWGSVVVASAALAFIVVLVVRPSWTLGLARRVAARLPGHAGSKLVAGLEAFSSGLGLIRRPRALVAAFLWSLVVWLWMAAAFRVAFLAFGIDQGFAAAVFTQCAVSMFVSVPAGPGFIGTLQAGVMVALHEVFGVAAGPALSLAVGYHIAGFIPVTLLGLFYAWRLGIRLRSLESEAEETLERNETEASHATED